MTGKCSLVKGVTKQPLLLLSSMLSREKQATPPFLRAAGLAWFRIQPRLAKVVVYKTSGSIRGQLHAPFKFVSDQTFTWVLFLGYFSKQSTERILSLFPNLGI